MRCLLAPAKLNLTLEVLGRRPDGYHTLRSLMVPIALYDRIELEPSAQPSFTSDDPALAEDNLVMRALAAVGAGDRFAVRLHKTVPAGGGLGGGSSDAAAIVRAAMDGELGVPAPSDPLGSARALGADVPFFLAGTAALVEGIGERVTPLGALPPWWVVVVRPPLAIGTAAAYGLLDRARESAPPLSRPRASSATLAASDALQRADFAALLEHLHNDFGEPIGAAYPEVAHAAEALRAAGARAALLSGSGSCLFALASDEGEARALAERLAPSAGRVFVAPFHHEARWR
ncbi:MAG: 4-(cytidine 5'-diphospho)-2-C-methyl-D-erythritol kinase [Vulcanimicrobiaceae bacterium]